MLYDDEYLNLAHTFSSHHKQQIEDSNICGCFYCLQTYKSFEVREWVSYKQMALCPICGIDTVIGDASGCPINYEFLAQMRDYWFSLV